mgnify:CR=1 FL=1
MENMERKYIDMEKPEAGMACGYQARGRPPKKNYDAKVLMQELIDTVTEVYQTTNEKQQPWNCSFH